MAHQHPNVIHDVYGIANNSLPMSRSPQLFRECAGILESMKQPAEAAAMYELGCQDHRAAAIYVAAKDLDKAATVMPRVTQPKLLGQYAKACEITGRCGDRCERASWQAWQSVASPLCRDKRVSVFVDTVHREKCKLPGVGCTPSG